MSRKAGRDGPRRRPGTASGLCVALAVRNRSQYLTYDNQLSDLAM